MEFLKETGFRGKKIEISKSHIAASCHSGRRRCRGKRSGRQRGLTKTQKGPED